MILGYCYPSGLEKTLCKWEVYVPLVTKGLKQYKKKTLFLLKTTQDRQTHSVLRIYERLLSLKSRGTYRSFATTVSQLKMFGFSGESFQGFEVL
jgi:hypothetical protein